MDSPMLSPSTAPHHRKTRLSCRRIDRLCCNLLCYFPLLFISGVSTWAVYTYSYSICWNNIAGLKGTLLNFLGLTLYLLLNWSYFTAVFTNPGSPLDSKHAYSSLPTTESSTASISVKSSGQARFCKKCQCYKPDRTHHCSSCKTCVLKMDHHCPWLANCLGMYNYKAFLLFLIYTSIFCIVCFVVSSAYVYEELLSSNARDKYPVDDFTPVNWVLLAVISGIIGLVLSGFTIWHLTLVGSGMTTIESLEKVRYTTPTLSRTGVPPPPGAHHLYDNPDNDPSYDYAAEREQERAQEFRRYNAYVLEESAKKLPHPFNLGKARNFRAVFGSREEWWMWFIPRFSGIGDGWTWETSNEWRVAAEAVRAERERMGIEQGDRESQSRWTHSENQHPAARRSWNGGNPNGLVRHAGDMKPSKAERILGKIPGTYSDGENVPLQRMNRAPGDISSDEEDDDDERIDLETGLAVGRRAKMEPRSAGTGSVGWGNWGRDESEERW